MADRHQLAIRRTFVPLVIAVELAYLAYFFSFELPNAPETPGGRISRLDVWQLAIPGLVPGEPCLAAQALARLADVRHLPQRSPIAGYAALIVAAALGLGALLLRALGIVPQRGAIRPQRQPIDSRAWPVADWLVAAYGLGASVVSLATLGIGLAGWMHRAVALVALTGAAIVPVILAGRWRARLRSTDQPERPSLDRDASPARLTVWSRIAFVIGVVAIGLFLAIDFLGAMLPATDFDVREYHVQGPKEFFIAGRIGFVPHNVYMNMPFGTEMLTLLGMIVAGDWWRGALVGQTVLATFAPMTALGVFGLARRLFSPAAGWLAALVYLTTPWVHRIAIIPYTENALCFFLLAATLVAVLALQSVGHCAQGRAWLVVGMLAGAAVSCKYPAIISTVFPLGLAAAAGPVLRRLRPSTFQPINPSTNEPPPAAPDLRALIQPIAIFAIGVAVACGPWLLKNWVLSDNPTYPLLYRVFGGRNWTPEKNSKWEWGHRVALLVALGQQEPPPGRSVNPNDSQHAITLRQLATNVIDVTAKADWLSPLLFALAPLALLSERGRRAAGWLWLFVIYLFFQWWLLTHRLDRFWVPLIPIAAVLAGAGATWSDGRVWKSFVAGVVVAAVFFNFSYATSGLCGDNRYSMQLVDRADPEPIAGSVINYLNYSLPADACVLAVGAADLFHLDRRVVYNTVFDDSILEQLVRDKTAEQAATALGERGVTHVYVSWSEVERYRGTYGFTEFVTPVVFKNLVAGGVLRPAVPLGPSIRVGDDSVHARELYEVRSPPAP